jgi:high affinity sulfate transporter 1
MTTEQVTQESTLSRLKQFFPITGWLPQYNRDYLRPDILAGLTLAAFTIPEAMAYAGLAGLPPQAGLYGGIAAPLIYLLFGTSRQLAIGVTSAVSILVASGLAGFAGRDIVVYAQNAALLALMVFVIALLARLLKLGFLVNFISEPVLLGFSSGAALYIGATQLPKLFGLHGCHGEVFERIACVVVNVNETHLPSLILGLTAIAILLLGEHFYHKLPWSLIVVLLSILIMGISGLGERGIAIAGEIPQGLPRLELPSFNIESIRVLLPTALAVFLLAYVEGMSMARTFASKHGYRIDANQELLALSMVNLGAGLTQAYPVAGSMSRTAVADSAGQKSQLAGGISAILIAVVVLFFTGFFTNLPEPVLAAVVLVAVKGLFKGQELRHLYHIQRKEFWIAIAALLGVLIFGMLEGVLIGVIISLLVLVGRASQSRISLLGRVPDTLKLEDVRDHPEYRTVPGLMIIRIDEDFFFANAVPVSMEIEELVAASEETVNSVLIDLGLSDELDVTSVEVLAELQQSLAENDITLMLSRVSPDARALLDRSGVADSIGAQRIFPRTLGAIAYHLEQEGIHVESAKGFSIVLINSMSNIYYMMAERAEEPQKGELQSIAQRLKAVAEQLESGPE